MAIADGLSLAALRDYIAKDLLSEAELMRLCKDGRAGAQKLATRALQQKAKLVQEKQRLAQMLQFERALWQRGLVHVAGVDEVGVGPMAGPVVAAAVVLAPETSIADINDSKRLDAEVRERLAQQIRSQALACAVGEANVAEIDALNIYHAALLAMQRAVEGLKLRPEHLLVDARTVPNTSIEQTAIIKGDTQSQSIAAASIVAKVHRDRWMTRLSTEYPGYGFERHKGYGTPEHLAAIERLGPCVQHRRGWASVARAASAPEQKRLF